MPLNAGSGPDVTARMFAEQLARPAWGHSIVKKIADHARRGYAVGRLSVDVFFEVPAKPDSVLSQ